jgi:thymidylate synthase (FAD)
VAIDAAQRTSANKWRSQAPTNKQGSGGYLPEPEGEILSAAEADLQKSARGIYESRLQAGVAREQARKDLPLSTYTEAYWKIDLHNLLHFLEVRMDAHAQEEIRSYATTIGNEIVARWVPLVWEAFVDYRQSAMRWSRLETEIINAVITGSLKRACQFAREEGLLQRNDRGELAPNRERAELEEKMRRLGLRVPWSSADAIL